MNIWDAFLFSRKILGMNSRNLSYIKPYNPKKGIKLVDNKIKFKKALQKNDIPTPKLLGTIRNSQELSQFDFDSLPKSFVLKPTSGFGGEGIVVIFGENKKPTDTGERLWVKGKGVKLSETDMKNHIKNILDGTYSRTNSPDIAFFEERIKLTKLFKPFAYKGIPDIRIIVFNRVPVMAMLRLPTRESDGKANLHQGGIGIGIDIATGVTTNAIMKGRFIETLPDTKLMLSGIRIPHWDTILEIAVRTADITNLGFTGIDIAIDRELGPVVLEANARPGLAIQIANLAPLKERLQKVSGLKIKTTKRAIRLAKDLFGGEIEEEIEGMTGKRLIGLSLRPSIHGFNDTAVEVAAKVDTGADSSSIDEALVHTLGYGEVFQEFEQLELPKKFKADDIPEIKKQIIKVNARLRRHGEGHLKKVAIIRAGNGYTLRPYIEIQLTLEGKTFFSTSSIVNRSHLTYPMLLGKADLKHFIIDPTKHQ